MSGAKGNKEAAKALYQGKIDGIKKQLAELPEALEKQKVALQEQFDSTVEELEVLLDHYEAKLVVLDAEKPKKPRPKLTDDEDEGEE